MCDTMIDKPQTRRGLLLPAPSLHLQDVMVQSLVLRLQINTELGHSSNVIEYKDFLANKLNLKKHFVLDKHRPDLYR